MVEGWRVGGADLSDAVVIRPSGRPVGNLKTVTSYAEAGPPPRLVVLGFKPQQLDEAVPKLGPFLTSRSIVVSILAGVEAATLRKRFPNAGAVVRALPNLPVAVRRGVVALYSDDIPDGLRDEVSQLFAMLGYALWTNSENNLAAIGSVAGAGPAYVARFIDALAKAGRRPRPVPGIGLDHCAGNGVGHVLDGRDDARTDGRGRSPCRQPEWHD